MAIAEVAVVAPSLAVGLPPKPTAGSGMDAMAHNAEGVLSLQTGWQISTR